MPNDGLGSPRSISFAEPMLGECVKGYLKEESIQWMSRVNTIGFEPE